MTCSEAFMYMMNACDDYETMVVVRRKRDSGGVTLSMAPSHTLLATAIQTLQGAPLTLQTFKEVWKQLDFSFIHQV